MKLKKIKRNEGQEQRWYTEIVVAGFTGTLEKIKTNKTKGDINKDQEQPILTMLKPKGSHSIFKKVKGIFFIPRI